MADIKQNVIEITYTYHTKQLTNPENMTFQTVQWNNFFFKIAYKPCNCLTITELHGSLLCSMWVGHQ